MKKQKRLIIIDGNALIHRSFHALPPSMKTKSGQVVNAVYGFSSFLLKALEEFQPEYVVLTFDKKGPTFRHEAYKEYKAQRVKAPDELYEQIPLAKKVAEAFNIPIYESDGFEADDVIGTIVKKVDGDIEKIIITGDMDTLQLIDKDTKVYTMSRGLNDSLLYSAKEVKDRYGLEPSQMIDYKGLRGDPSDNLPGVKGIGEKTATELLQTFKNLDGVYQAAEKKDPRLKDRIRELLLEHKEEAYLSQKLARIDSKAPVKFSLDDSSFGPLDQTAITKIFSELEFKSLLNRLGKITAGKNFPTEKPEHDKFERNQKKFHYHLIDNESDLEKFLKDLEKQKLFSLDSETTSLDPLTTEIVGLSFSWKENEAYYLNLIDHKSWLEKLKKSLENEEIKKCGHNLKFDWRVLKNQGIEVKGLYFDSMIASYLLNPEKRQHSLDALSFAELGWEKINFSELFENKKIGDLKKVDPKKLALYAGEDADFAFKLLKPLEKRLKEEKLFDLFSKIEIPLIPVLGDMENNGIALDEKKLENMKKEVSGEIKKLEKKIHNLAGEDFNINSTKQLKEILYEKLALGTKGIKKTKTGFSTAAEELEKMKDLHPIIPLLQDYRELSKLLNTYIEALPVLINSKTKRLHTSFNQAITATGRLSSTEPNLQNIPTRTELGRRIRQAFIAQKGNTLLSLDYSQIELRLVAHIANDPKMIEAFNKGVDIHTQTAAEINNVPLEKVTKDMRREAKAINFGIIYGQGPFGLSESAGISMQKAKEFIAKYFKAYAEIKKYIEKSLEKASEKGYIETLFGRKRYLPEINSNIQILKRAAERMAINMPFQGTVADMMKLSMIRIRERFGGDKDLKMLLQVHDELIFEVQKTKAKKYAKEIQKIMQEVIKLKVPVVVDVNFGENWGEIK